MTGEELIKLANSLGIPINKIKEPEPPKCSLCKDKGFIISEKGAKDCYCRKRKRWEDKLNKEGWLERLEKNTFDTFKVNNKEEELNKKKAIRFTEDYKSKNFILTGNVGNGKTHLALAIINKIAEDSIKSESHEHIIPTIVSYPDLISELVETKSFSSQYEMQEILEKYKKPAVLLLDDLFKGVRSQEAIAWTYSIINSRYNERKTTIVTTEFKYNQLEKIDEAIASRLIELTDNGKYAAGFNGDNKRTEFLK